jgi:uncharacterized protein (TIGR02271 family)
MNNAAGGAPTSLQVVDQNGIGGTLDLTVVPPQGSESRLVLVRFGDGSSAFADAAVFVEQQPNLFFFPGSFADLRGQTSQPLPVAQANQESVSTNQEQLINNQSETVSNSTFSANQGERLIVPVLAEQLRVAREQVVTGGVRVRKTVHERVETIDQPVIAEQVDVERVAINRFIDEAPAVRYEGDVMVVPLLEEVIVVEKRLVLREEVRIRKQRATVSRPQQVVLRREEATLEPIDPEATQINDRNRSVGNG